MFAYWPIKEINNIGGTPLRLFRVCGLSLIRKMTSLVFSLSNSTFCGGWLPTREACPLIDFL